MKSQRNGESSLFVCKSTISAHHKFFCRPVIRVGGTILLRAVLLAALLPGFVHAAAATPPTLSEYRTTYEQELEKICTNNAAAGTAKSDYARALDALQVEFKKKGDYDSTMAVIAERKRFLSEKTGITLPTNNLPPGIGKAYTNYLAALSRIQLDQDQQITKLNSSYVKVLKELIKDLLAVDKMTEAAAVNVEIKKIATELKTDKKPATAPSSRSAVVTATGGDTINYVSDDKRYTAWIFTNTDQAGVFTLSGGSLICDVLVVGGGGGGGSGVSGLQNGGGGGGGGVVFTRSLILMPQTYSVVIGVGGSKDTNGRNSVFSKITAVGGGHGGGLHPGVAGGKGGSGGGSAFNGGKGPGSGIAGQGHNGGAPRQVLPNHGGGGGGAGAVGYAGKDHTNPGTGGNGMSNSISGANAYYGGGGGAGADANPGAGGLGGGGAGVTYQSVTGGNDGMANTGGGGGGGASRDWNAPGGKGGSGIVIIRYQSSDS